MSLLLACAVEQPTPTATASDTSERVDVPAATFAMGHADATFEPYGNAFKEDEFPAHEVSVSAFRLDRHEVTVARWAVFLDAQGPEVHSHPLQPLTWDGHAYVATEDEHARPVRFVSWYDAVAFCAWAGGRLPTEAEWELAARGTDGRAYPWGEGGLSCTTAVYFTGSSFCADRPAPVGEREDASPYGAQDLAGNVAEWVGDRYGAYSAEPAQDPRGPDTGAWRVLRGGGLHDSAKGVRTTARVAADPADRSEGAGFRCAWD